MKTRRKATVGFIEDETARKSTFKKRKQGFFKKLDQIVKLCDVKACAVVFSQCEAIPEAWPSREGFEEVVSTFKQLPGLIQTQKMVDQREYLEKRITKAKKHLRKLRVENLEFKNQELMFSCLRGEKIAYRLEDERDLRDFKDFINKYDDELTHRFEILMENGESSYLRLLPPPPPPPAPRVVADVDEDTMTLIRYYDQIQCENVNENHKEPIRLNYQSLYDFYDQLPQKLNAFIKEFNLNPDYQMVLGMNELHDSDSDYYPSPNKKQSFMNMLREKPGDASEQAYEKLDLNSDLTRNRDPHKMQMLVDILMKYAVNGKEHTYENHDLDLNMNPNPSKKQSFMDLLKEQIANAREHGYIPSMDDSHHQPSTATPEVCAPNITNNP